MKKVLAFIITLTLITSSFSVVVNAVDETDEGDSFSWGSLWDDLVNWIDGFFEEDSNSDSDSDSDSDEDNYSNNFIGDTEIPDLGDYTEDTDVIENNVEVTPFVPKDIYLVTSSKLNIRESMSTSSTILATLVSGDLVTLEESCGEWLKISYNGVKGYADSTYLVNVNTATADDKVFVFAGKYNVTSSYLYIRKAPSASAEYNLYIQKGTQVDVYDAKDNWYYVGYNGDFGWACADYLEYVTASNNTLLYVSDPAVSGEYTVIGSKLSIRLAKSSTSDIIGTVTKNEKVIVYRIEDDWAYINYNNVVGWVTAAYLEKNIDESNENDKGSDKYVVVASKLTIRSAPSKNASIVGYLYNGSIINVFSIDEEWASIEYDNMRGYVNINYISFLCSSTSEVSSSYQPSSLGTGKVVANGIDVSKWNGTIDWDKVRKSGIDYVIIRMGYSGCKDPRFEEYYAGAKLAGLDVGAYIYSYSESVAEAANDAQDCVSWAKGKTFEYPIYFDIEDQRQKALSADVNTDMCFTFCQILKDNGYLPGIYTGASFIGDHLNKGEIMQNCEVWIARYYDGTSRDGFGYSSTYGMWQYSEEGVVNGIPEKTDMNVCFKDYPSIVKEYGLNGYLNSGFTNKAFFKATVLKDVCGGNNVNKILTQYKDNVVVLDRNGNVVPSDSPISSGYKINVYENGVLKSAITVILNGDFTLDSDIKMDDVTSLQKYVADMISDDDLVSYQFETGDINSDGEITMLDVVVLQKYIAGILSTLE